MMDSLHDQALEIMKFQGLDKLHQAISEALEIEACSICLGKLEDTALVWPCGHWFCSKCVSRLHESLRGEKVSCPLCKKSTTRRSILPFYNQQKEYADYLQTLIGAISLDIGFDISSFKSQHKNEPPDESNNLSNLSPIRLTRLRSSVRVNEKKIKYNYFDNGNKKVTRTYNCKTPRSKNIQSSKNNSVLQLETIRVNESNDNKVQVWLDSSNFSQAEPLCATETVVVDIHRPDCEFYGISEDQLQSVTQIESKASPTIFKRTLIKHPCVTPLDIEAIKPFNNFSLDKSFETPSPKQNAKIVESLYQEEKLRSTSTKYRSKNPNASRQDVLISNEKSFGQNKTSLKTELVSSSQECLEDFSSGSGEEWSVGRKIKHNFSDKKIKSSNKKLTCSKNAKSSIKGGTTEKITRSSVKLRKGKDIKTISKNEERPPKFKTNNNIRENKPFAPVKSNSSKICLLKVNSGPTVKEINDERENIEYIENLPEPLKSMSICDSVDKHTNMPVETTLKLINQQSPGWSKLAKTKKEFHMRERNKLSLKTLNTSNLHSSSTTIGISPLKKKCKVYDESINQPISDINQYTTLSSENFVESTPKKFTNENIYFALSDVDSPFKGFSTSNEIINENGAISKKKLSPKSLLKPNTITTISSLNTKDSDCHRNINQTIPDIKQHTAQNFENVLASGPPKSLQDRGLKFQTIETYISPSNKPIVTFEEDISETLCDIVNHSTPKKHRYQNNTDLSSATIQSPSFRKCPTSKEISDWKERENLSQQNVLLESGSQTKCNVINTCKEIRNDNIFDLSKDKSIVGPLGTDFVSFNVDKQDLSSKSNKIESTSNSIKKSNSLDLAAFKINNRSTQKNTQDHVELNKKRNRDSEIHNERELWSPVKKRSCQDAEVQTSPGCMQSYVKDLLKNMWGMEVEKTFKSNLNYPSKILNSGQEETNPLLKISPFCDQTQYVGGNLKDLDNQNHSFTNIMSQHSDKENMLSHDLNSAEKCFNDSDFVLGTEHFNGPFFKNVMETKDYKNQTTTKVNTDFLKKQHLLVDSDSYEDVDPEAVTQPYKTPVVPKRIFKTPTKHLFSAVSDPTNSDFKRLSDSFSKSDIIFPDDTPRIATPMNHSGINHLESNSSTLNKDTDLPLKSTSQGVQENANKIKRQLYFVEGESTSNDMFDSITPRDLPKESRLDNCNNFPETTKENSGDELLFEQINKNPISTVQKDGLCVDVKNDSSEKAILFNSKNIFQCVEKEGATEAIVVPNQKIESEMEIVDGPFKKEHITKLKTVVANNIEVNSDEVSSEVSIEDCIVEGTPDVSQIEAEHQYKNLNKKLNECNDTEIKDKIDKISNYDSCPEKTFNVNCIAKMEERLIKTGNFNSNASHILKDEEEEVEYYCFASSLLSVQQNNVLHQVLNSLNIPYSKTVGNHITHLVVGTSDSRTQHTYKVLYAMALHKPIIRFDWVEEIVKAGETVPLDSYLALDPSGECGVLRALKDKRRILLQEFAICVYNGIDKVIEKDQIEELIKLCGGTLVPELNLFHSVPRNMFRVVILSATPNTQTEVSDCRQKYAAVEVSVDWIYNTIGRYRVVPLASFAVDSTDIIPFLQHEGYPEDLIFDTPTQT